MLLAIDVGNTQTVVGLYDGDQLLDHWRLATNADYTPIFGATATAIRRFSARTEQRRIR